MKTSVKNLWNSHDQAAWHDALGQYWEAPSVLRNLEIEKFMDTLDVGSIRTTNTDGWRAFLTVYFHWKFTESRWLDTRLQNLAANSESALLSIKKNLFSLTPSQLSDTTKALRIVTQIKGLSWAGGSGLLAVLFPNLFGTADQFVVKSLNAIPSLPERLSVVSIEPTNLRERDAVLLIKIMRSKAASLNALFGTSEWTPRKIDMILWTLRDEQDSSACN